MRSAFLYLAQFAAALPIAQRSSMPTIPPGTQDVNVLEFDVESAWTRFTVSPGYKDGRIELTTSPLVFELNVNRASDVLATDITINDQRLDVKWDTTVADGTLFATISSPSTQVLTVPDDRGALHFVDVLLSGNIPVDWKQRPLREPAGAQYLRLLVLAVDEFAVKHFELDIVSHPLASSKRLQKIYRISNMQPAGSEARNVPVLSAKTAIADPFTDDHQTDSHAGELDIEAEIESLLLLEAQASDLATQIAAKKHGISRCLRDHRENVSLGHLLRQCDGVVCAAKVIAQRICDKMGVETIPDLEYVQVQDSQAQQLIQLGEGEKDNVGGSQTTAASGIKNSLLAGNGPFMLHSTGAAVRQSMEIVYPQSMLYRVLGVIACACGLTALFGFIRRKCISARRMVDELAEAEERRTARAYRRAARRADMRKRWEAFLRSVNCFSMSTEEPLAEKYEEKRALILQDAFLEQDMDAAEKGEIMEAEIRELRHAHDIVSNLVRVDENRYDLAPLLVNDPPPPLLPLPSGRSRASTGTLPSYTSELLPDYRSRDSTVSTTIASSSCSMNGSSDYSPPTSSSEKEEIFTAADTGSTPRSFSPEGSTGTRTSHMTEFSSVIEISPRASEETLRTLQRSSMAWSHPSQDTNDL